MNVDILEIGARVAKFFIPFLFALCFHEFAHGWMARRKGDNTAEMLGRLNLNPLSHIDWVGTVIFPIVAVITGMPLFGWAKPVPVNPRNLKNPKEDMFWIAFAGPLSNVLLFVVGLGAVFLINRVDLITGALAGGTRLIFNEMLQMFLILNLFLAIFNMIPIHPLDGGKVLQRFLPYHWNRWLEEHQAQLNMVLLAMFIFGFFRYLAYPVYYITEVCWSFVLGGFL